ncbi:MAG TPA: hypothetical protein VGL77_18160, partial [Armatimonadota bacterium]
MSLTLMSALCALPGSPKLYSLNYVNLDVATVMKSLADMSGANIIVAPDVKGAISLKLKDVTVE